MDYFDFVLAAKLAGQGGGGGDVVVMTGLLDDVSQRANAERAISESQAGHIVIYERFGKIYILSDAYTNAAGLTVNFVGIAFTYDQSSEYGDTGFRYQQVTYNNDTDRFTSLTGFSYMPPIFTEETPGDNYGIVHRGPENRAYVNFPGLFVPNVSPDLAGRALVVQIAGAAGYAYASWQQILTSDVSLTMQQGVFGEAIAYAIAVAKQNTYATFYLRSSDQSLVGMIRALKSNFIASTNKFTNAFPRITIDYLIGNVLNITSDHFACDAEGFDQTDDSFVKVHIVAGIDTSGGTGQEEGWACVHVEAHQASPFPQM